MGGDRLMEEEILGRDKKGLQRALASINQLTREREEFACSLTVCLCVC